MLWLHPGVENGARNASGPCQPNADLAKNADDVIGAWT
jgi:hypothetical protein